ncbi:MAG: hypothetical protein WBC29_00915 [Candidatus Moraniibacteriota bacterium]
MKIIRESQTRRGVMLASLFLLLGVLLSLIKAAVWFLRALVEGDQGLSVYEAFSWVIFSFLLVFPYAFIYPYLPSEVRSISDKEIEKEDYKNSP